MTTLTAEQVQIGIAGADPIWAVYFTFAFDNPMPTDISTIVGISRHSTADQTFTDPWWEYFEVFGGDYIDDPTVENPTSALFVLPPNLLVDGLETWWSIFTLASDTSPPPVGWPYEEAFASLTISIPAAAAEWTTIAAVRTMLGALEAGYTDAEITTAIQRATARLSSVFCVDVVTSDTSVPPGLPVDTNVREATTVMAARILIAPATGVPPVQGGQITSERMGSYSYSVRPGTAPSHSGPMAIDGVIKDLVGGYVCPGIAGLPAQTDIWPYEAPLEEVT